MEILEGNDEDIELSLGLSIGGGRSFKKFEKSNQEKSSLTFEIKFLDQNDNNNNDGLDLEKRKREIHKMRRKEARKNRDIKKNGRKPGFEQQEEDEQSSSFKKLKPENEEMGKEKGDVSNGFGYHHQSMQCFNPFSNGFGFPAAYQMMPLWVPPPTSTSSSPETTVVDDKKLVQPIVCKPFIRAFQFSDSPPMDKISDDGAVIRDSDSCGSAVVEDHQIGSQFDNETSSTRSAQSPPLNKPHHLHESHNGTSSSSCSKPPLPLSPNKVTDDVETNKEETNKPPESEIPQIKALPKMPCVSTVGDGPNGKTITGFLYRYTNAEVSIVCVCHGTSFSPAEFVKHAGRTDVSQPLKHILVLPTPFS